MKEIGKHSAQGYSFSHGMISALFQIHIYMHETSFLRNRDTCHVSLSRTNRSKHFNNHSMLRQIASSEGHSQETL